MMRKVACLLVLVFVFGPRLLLAAEAKNEEVEKKLKEPVSFDFVETPLCDVVEFLRGAKKVNIVLDLALVKENPNVTLKVENMPFGEALKRICACAKTGFAVQNNVIVIGSAEFIKKCSEKPPEHEALKGAVSLDFVSTPLCDVAEFLSSMKKVKIVRDAALTKEDPNVTLKVENVPYGTALQLICAQVGAVFTLQDGCIVMKKKAK